jgi:hypothetical protein
MEHLLKMDTDPWFPNAGPRGGVSGNREGIFDHAKAKGRQFKLDLTALTCIRIPFWGPARYDQFPNEISLIHALTSCPPDKVNDARAKSCL